MGKEFQDICAKSASFKKLLPHTHPNTTESLKDTTECSKKGHSHSDTTPDSLADSGYPPYIQSKKPPSSNIVGCQWTFRVKRDNLGAINKFKASLVTQGFSQVKGLNYNETFSPTIKFTTIRLMIALACRYNLELRNIDIKGAYLNGKLEDDIYMRQPEGFMVKGKEHLVCKLHKSMYSLKQLGRIWHHTLKQGLEKLGFTAGEANSTIFFRFQGNSIEIAGWYVDDGLLAADSSTTMKKMIDDIGGSFDIQDLGKPERLLGIRIKRNRDVGTIHLSQPTFINTIAKHFNITIRRPTKSPMDATINYWKTNTDDKPADIPYASIIGSLNYCAIATRPDISYATNKCAQFTSRPSQVHWEAAKRILQYLLQT